MLGQWSFLPDRLCLSKMNVRPFARTGHKEICSKERHFPPEINSLITGFRDGDNTVIVYVGPAGVEMCDVVTA